MTSREPQRAEPTFMHVPTNARVGPFDTVPIDSSNEARALVPRIITAYHRAMDEFRAPARSMWDDIQQHNADFCAALERSDAEAVFGYLRGMFQSNLIWGLGFVAEEVTRTEHDRDHYLRLLTDALVSLSECVGQLSVKCIEQQGPEEWMRALDVDLEDVVRALSSYGVNVSFPGIAAAYGSTLGGQFVTVDSVVQSALVWRLRQLGATPASSIVEIGGGYGCQALKALQAGLHCRIYDLPWVNAVQGYFLGLGAGAGQVSLFGERPAAIQVLPHWKLGALPDRSVDFVVSANALAEMGRETASRYVRQIDRCLNGYFLSIGQEAQTRYRETGPQNQVLSLVRQTERLRLVSRQLWWMRQGYVEEVYTVPRRTLSTIVSAAARQAPLSSRGLAARAYHSRIGRRLFGGAARTSPGAMVGRADDLATFGPTPRCIRVRVEGATGRQVEVCPTTAGTHELRCAAGSRIAADLGRRVDAGYRLIGDELFALPIGSSLDATTGRFVWQPPVSWLGRFHFVFTSGPERIDMTVTMTNPSDTSDVALHLDTPVANTIVSGAFVVAGWALDPLAPTGAGIIDLAVTAHRSDGPGSPQFADAAAVGGLRPDVAATFGDQFEAAGFTLTVPGLAPGVYDLHVSPRTERPRASEQTCIVRIVVADA
jgi:hypothetical protein